jgi:enoyl-CoA hydratase/carnithine racemase
MARVIFTMEKRGEVRLVRLCSEDGTNRLQAGVVSALADAVAEWSETPGAIVLTGNQHFFSAGADLKEINALTGPAAFAFGRMGQRLMQLVDDFPCPVVAAISSYCMGGGLDLALACDRRVAAPNAIFGHRGAALGLMTGWGGTQRLPRLIGKGRALQMFLAAEKLHAQDALRIGLVDEVSDDPVAAALAWLSRDGD